MSKKHREEHETSVTQDTEEEGSTSDSSTEDHHSHSIAEEEANDSLQHSAPPRQKLLARLKHWIWTNKKISIPAVLALPITLLAVIPFTRYTIAGTLIKRPFQVVILDNQTSKPVSDATITLNGQNVKTNNQGEATLLTKVGYASLLVTKKYYKSYSQKILVPIQKTSNPLLIRLKADGRPVPLTVIDTISKQPIANVVITANGTETKTDNQGKTIVVVPIGKDKTEIRVSGQGFNTVTAMLTVTTEEIEANTFSLTPTGKIYFLSNASGKLDMVKSNLDGSDRQTVLAGTGKEDRDNTILLASRDWKYIALLSKRDGGEYAKLFLVETATDKLTTIDEGEADFTVYGWSNDRLIYLVNRANRKVWEDGQQALKSYNAPAQKLTTLAETAADGDGNGYANENFNNVYILGEEIVYIKNWGGGCGYGYSCYASKLDGKQATLNTIHADGSQKKNVKSYNDLYLEAVTAEFGEVYILFTQDKTRKVDEYHDGKAQITNLDGDDFINQNYPVYSVAPSGNKTLWSKFIDGKTTFFVGDGKGKNGKQIGRSEDFTVYGWFTDEYVLLTKKGSELYIVPASGLDGEIEKSLKITDYYKPSRYFNRGFGYGYGG